jgi:hypothetical protein
MAVSLFLLIVMMIVAIENDERLYAAALAILPEDSDQIIAIISRVCSSTAIDFDIAKYLLAHSNM